MTRPLVRLIVACSVDTPSAADTIASAVRGEGRSVAVIEADAVETATGSTPWSTVLTATQAGESWSRSTIEALASSWHAAVLSTVEAALAHADVDVIVLDAGDHRSARRLLSHARAIRAATADAINPSVAVRSDSGADSAFVRLREADACADRQEQMLTGPTCVWRVAVAPVASAGRRAVRTLGALAVLGARVDEVLLDRYPRPSAPKDERRAAARVRRRIAERSDLRPRRRATGTSPRGRSVGDAAGIQPVLTTDPPVVVDARWTWRIALPRAARGARVGLRDEQVVVEVDGARRWIGLPPVLRRTTASDAQRVGSDVVLRFDPDPTVWPGRTEESAGRFAETDEGLAHD